MFLTTSGELNPTLPVHGFGLRPWNPRPCRLVRGCYMAQLGGIYGAWRVRVRSLSALIDNQIFCVHGGLSPAIATLDQVILRPPIPDLGPSPSARPTLLAWLVACSPLPKLQRTLRVMESGTVCLATRQVICLSPVRCGRSTCLRPICSWTPAHAPTTPLLLHYMKFSSHTQ